MDMITILNTIPMVEGNNNEIFFFIGLALAIVFGVIACFKDSLICFVVFLVGLMLLFFGIITGKNFIPEKYECTINEGVSFKQFSDAFIVDNQRGDIYTVHLKADEK